MALYIILHVFIMRLHETYQCTAYPFLADLCVLITRCVIIFEVCLRAHSAAPATVWCSRAFTFASTHHSGRAEPTGLGTTSSLRRITGYACQPQNKPLTRRIQLSSNLKFLCKLLESLQIQDLQPRGYVEVTPQYCSSKNEYEIIAFVSLKKRRG